jgi:uncharacterized repeat protein (TIGR03803 family)
MKKHFKSLFLLPTLIAVLGLIADGRVTAQTFTTLHHFTASITGTNSDGAFPYAGLILSGNTLYGTALEGGSLDGGTVFALNSDGTGFTTLHSFAAHTSGTNSDGSTPYAGLILSGNTLYGTAKSGGASDCGTVFKINTDGTSFTTLHSFTATSGPDGTNSDGANPFAGLILSGNTLYGAAWQGGRSGAGTVFALATNGTGFTTLHSFTALSNSTNGDGAYPNAGLILSGNTLYGTANQGGISGYGTVFAINTIGTGFTNLHSFVDSVDGYPTDGAFPVAGLILSGNTLYGTANQGGTPGGGHGTVFAINTDGSGFRNLYSFTNGSDGAFPVARLISSGNSLYGTASEGGSSGSGTVFSLNTDGTSFRTLHSFTALSDSTNTDGTFPNGIILSGNTLYGTAYQGGSSDNGTVFSLSLGSASAPQLTIVLFGANVILTWPANAAGFTLQSTANLASPAIWSTVFPGPTIVNGQNAVTNPISGTRKFYRLSQ